jgi:hypothetical protein
LWLDTPESQSGGLGQGENHHQGLARSHKLSNGDIYFFLSHSEIGGTGNLSQFRYPGRTLFERVDQVAGKYGSATALLEQLLPLSDESPPEEHPSDINFLPDIDNLDAGYLFVAKEYDARWITVYKWSPGEQFARIGNIHVPFKAVIRDWVYYEISLGILSPDVLEHPSPDMIMNYNQPSHVFVDRFDDDYYLVVWDNDHRTGWAYRADKNFLFPTSGAGKMNVGAFRLQNSFQSCYDLGSQAKFVRDSTGKWYLLAYLSDGSDESAPSSVAVYDIAIAPNHDFWLLGPQTVKNPVPITLPDSGVSFSSTGTHHVDGSTGMLLIYSSYRWADDKPGYYVSLVDECARDWS